MAKKMSDIQVLKSRVEYLEEVSRFTLDALQMAASLGDFQTPISRFEKIDVILRETYSRIQRIISFTAAAFFLTDEDTGDFFPTYCVPSERQQELSWEMDHLIDKGVLAWALEHKKAVLMPVFLEMQYTGKRYTAQECEARQIVRKACPLDQLMPEALAFAKGLNKKREMISIMKQVTYKEIVRVMEEDDPAYVAGGRTGLG